MRHYKNQQYRQTPPLGLVHLSFFLGLRLTESCQRRLIFFPIKPSLFQLEHTTSGCGNQFAGDHEDSVSNGLDRILCLLLIQHLFFKEIHEIVGEHQEFEPGIVSGVAVGDHLIQAKTINPFFDEVFATGPFVIIPPDLRWFFIAVGQNHLVVVFHIAGVQEFKLFPGTILAPDLLPYKNHPQGDIFLKDIVTLPRFHTTTYIRPILHLPDFPLDPGLDRNNHVKLNRFLDQKRDHIPAEETPIGPEPYLLDMSGQSLDHPFEKLNSLIRAVVFAAPEKASDIVPRLPDKAQKGMITLSSFLLGIVSKACSLLTPIYGGNVRIQIQGDAFICLEPSSESREKIKVKRGNLSGNRDFQRLQKTTDCRLNRKGTKIGNPLKHPVSCEHLHMCGSRIAQKDSNQAIGGHLTGAILAPPSALYVHPIVKSLPDLVLFKKSPNETGTTKSGEILSSEFFFDLAKMLVVFLWFLMYILFHFLSASSVVFWILCRTHYYYSWRHFC